MKQREYVKRSFVKAISYRVLIILSTFVVVLLLTGNVEVTTSVTVMTTIVNTALYFFHERVWNALSWGRARK